MFTDFASDARVPRRVDRIIQHARERMRVLHLLDHSLPIHSGYAFRSAEILNAQKQLGWHVLAVTGPKQPGHAPEEILYQRAPFRTGLLRRIPVIEQFEVIRALRHRVIDIARNERISLLHAHSPSLNGLAALWAAKSLNLPVVYEMRASWEDAAVDHGTSAPGGIRYRLTRASETYVFRHADAITTICEGLRDDISSRGIPSREIAVIPNAVDVNRFLPRPESRNELRQRYGVDQRFVLCFCGSPYAYEGLDFLLTAVSELRTRLPGILVLIAGEGEQTEVLRKIVAEGSLHDSVRLLGRIPQEDVVDIYNLADVCVFPRRRIKLTDTVTPLKPLEAMSVGGVVLGSDVGGHRELIEDGKTGFLFDADVVESLKEKILMLSNAGDLAGVRSAARKFVESERTWIASVSRYRDVYRRILDENRPAA